MHSDKEKLLTPAAGADEPTRHRSDTLVARVVADRYEILERVGRGGWSTVYRARDVSLNRTVALKLLHAYHAENEVKIARFRNEAKAASTLVHPNTVAVFDFGQLPDGQPYIVMEFVEGKTLNDLLELSNGLKPGFIIPILKQVCDGLEAIHSKGVIHRDLKPTNIITFVNENDQTIAKVGDFGLAKSVLEDGAGMTQTGETVGTPSYMSPEQCQGLHLDCRSDIYSLGCIMYLSLTGHPPFTGSSPWEYMQKHIVETPPAFAKCTTQALPKALEDITFKCLAKEPINRFQTVGALKQALELYEKGEFNGAGGFKKMVAYRRAGLPLFRWNTSPKRRVMLSAAVASALVLSGLAFFLTPRPQPKGATVRMRFPVLMIKRLPMKSLKFSSQYSLGTIVDTRDENNEHPLGEARGVISIPAQTRLCLYVSPDGLKHLDDLAHCGQSFTRLDFSHSGLKPGGFPQLKDIGEIIYVVLNNTGFGDKDVSKVGVLKPWELDVGHTRITDAGLKTLAKAVPTLHYLDVSGDNVSGDGLFSLASLELDGLVAADAPKLLDGGSRPFSTLNGIKWLNLSGQQHLTAATMKDIGANPRLEILKLDGSNLDDSLLGHLGHMKLYELHVANTAISDASLPEFANGRNLSVLDVRGTRMTAQGVETLRKQMPRLKVFY